MNKKLIKNEIVNSLKGEEEVEKIIIFGSFNKTDEPNDLDIAVIQNSPKSYLDLSLKYRKLLRNISKQISIDVVPLKENFEDQFFVNEIKTGEIIYARRY